MNLSQKWLLISRYHGIFWMDCIICGYMVSIIIDVTSPQLVIWYLTGCGESRSLKIPSSVIHSDCSQSQLLVSQVTSTPSSVQSLMSLYSLMALSQLVYLSNSQRHSGHYTVSQSPQTHGVLHTSIQTSNDSSVTALDLGWSDTVQY